MRRAMTAAWAALLLAAVSTSAGAQASRTPTSRTPASRTSWGGRYVDEVAHGDRLLAAGEYPAAAASFRRAHALTPSAWSASYRLGLTYYRWAERVPARREWALEQAARASAEAVALESTAVEAWRLLGAVQHARGLSADALLAYRKAVRLRGGDASLLCDLAVAAAAAGHRDEAGRALADARAAGADPGLVARTAAALSVAP